MLNKPRLAAAALAVVLAGGLSFAATREPSRAADHLDPPARTDPAVDPTPDSAADIADVYAWHTDTSVIIAMTFSGPQPLDRPASYDRNVLYTINIANGTNKTMPTIPLQVRFGNGTGPNQFGVQVTGLPGVTDGIISGPVETNLSRDGVMVRAGLFDDPFFFDLVGFRQTRDTGTLAFNNRRDFFAGQNDTAIVIEIPRSRIANGTNPIGVWATSARFGGNL